MSDMYDYTVDAVQRSFLFTDTMRKRGNMYLDHVAAGRPPVLVFDYEMVITDEAGPDGSNDRKVEFVERDMADILMLDDGLEDEKAFGGVSAFLLWPHHLAQQRSRS
jgi:hypothetical protein